MQMFILGVIVGALIMAVLFAMMNSARTVQKERDPADWWKNGGEPPC